MTTKIEITITENDNIYFIYVYREKTLLHTFQVSKRDNTPKRANFIEAICNLVGNSVTRIIKHLLEGGD